MPERMARMHPPTDTTPGTPQSFGARLRRERERRKISIASIAESTKILGALLEGLERDDVSRWPIGFYRRAFIRAYAASVGLDQDDVLREFTQRFPEPEEPTAVVAATSDRRARLRLTASQRISWFVGGRLLDLLPPRLNAVGFDVAVLGAVSVVLFVALGMFWAPLCFAAFVYYCGGILVLGNTPGVCLFAPSNRPPTPEQPGASRTGAGPNVEPPNDSGRWTAVFSTWVGGGSVHR